MVMLSWLTSYDHVVVGNVGVVVSSPEMKAL